MSALNAFGKKMQTSANNVANMYSDDFKKSRAVLTEGQNGHVTVDITKIDTPGPLVKDPDSETGELKELSNTDIAEEFSQQIITEKGFAANTKAFQTHDEMLGTIVNIIE
jgi:flagellar hook protein FlgE